MITTCRESDFVTGKKLMTKLVADLRGSALGFRNLANYIARSLLETGGFRPQLLHRQL
jgi:hypothetical protein